MARARWRAEGGLRGGCGGCLRRRFGVRGQILVAEAHQLHWVPRVFLLDLGDEVVGLGPLRDWYARAAHYWLRKRDRLPYLDRGGALRLRGDDLRRARAHRGRRWCLELVQLGLEGEELVIRHFFRRARPAPSPKGERLRNWIELRLSDADVTKLAETINSCSFS